MAGASASNASSVIPSVVHWVYPGADGEPWPYWAYVHAAAVVDVLQPASFLFHHEGASWRLHYESSKLTPSSTAPAGSLPSGRWWEATRPLLTLSAQPRATSVYGAPVRLLAHQSDVTRLGALIRHGGTYLDTDVLVVRPFSPLMGHHFVAGVQSHGRTANAVLLSRRGGEFVRRWADAYHSFRDTDWDAHSVREPWRLAEAHPQLVTWLPKTAWFDPGPDDDPTFQLFIRNLSATAFAERPAGFAHHLWHTVTAAALAEVTGPGWVRSHPATLYGRHLLRLAKSGAAVHRALRADIDVVDGT